MAWVFNLKFNLSFQYRVLNCILFSNDLFKIGCIAIPNCTFCNEALETFQHLLFYCTVSQAFWNDVIHNILGKLSSCRYLLLSNVIVGFLGEENWIWKIMSYF